MTPYNARDLAEDWEFKILRSATGAFKDRQAMQQYLAEEEQAGWVLVEKFDNSRIRLKRPATARRGDANLSFDPYRINVGMTEVNLALCIAGSIIGAIALMVAGIVFFVKGH